MTAFIITITALYFLSTMVSVMYLVTTKKQEEFWINLVAAFINIGMITWGLCLIL